MLVLTDDMRLDDLAAMPHTRELIGDQGTAFATYLDNVSLCCPARTTILRGQYAANTGVESNGGNNGGFQTAHDEGDEESTIATWLQGAGYHTGLFGKYLNGYPGTAGDTFVPPGWTEFDSPTRGGNPYAEFDYTLNENGRLVHYGHQPDDYGTDVYARKTVDFIRASAAAGAPFFAEMAVYAPHQPATPAPRHADLFADRQAPRDGAFDEADVSDKPTFVRDRPPLAPAQIRRIDTLYRDRLRSLQAVDEAVAHIVDTLRETGRLDSTYLVFTSDNGFHLGQHRLPQGKQTAYDTDIRLPLLVRGPGVPAGRTVEALVGNVDLAPTFAALAGTPSPDFVDGRSLAGLVHGEAPSDWRRMYLVEHFREEAGRGRRRQSSSRTITPTTTDNGGVTLEPPDEDQAATDRPASAAAASDVTPFHGLRTDRFTYVEYETGERELYDDVADPDQLVNLVPVTDTATLQAWHDDLAALVTCQAQGCRDAEQQRPPGG